MPQLQFRPVTKTVPVVSIAPSTIGTLQEHADALIRQHHGEVNVDKVDELAVDWERYHGLERAGLLVVLAAWADQRLVGYSVTQLTRPLHYKDTFVGYNTALFLLPEFRGTGVRLMRATKDRVRAEGADKLLWHCKPNSDLHNLLQAKSGCRVQDIVYEERL